MSFVDLRQLGKVYPDGTEAVRNISLAVEEGEFVVLLGPSGCGKTTTLRMIAGLEKPTSGYVVLEGRDITPLPPSRRDVGFVFQFYALYPHLTVRENILFPLRAVGTPRREREQKLMRVAGRLGLVELLPRYPPHLSGGDRQRVALARSMVRRPAIYLMDEPLGTLDADLRAEMREFIRAQQLDMGVTTIYVTHDQEEAMGLADRIVVMEGGEVKQVASPSETYRHPASLFVARFVGSPGMNLVAGAVTGSAGERVFSPSGGDQRIPVPSSWPTGEWVLGIRAEHVRPGPGGKIKGTVVMNEYMGSWRAVHADTTLGRIVLRTGPDFPARPGAGLDLLCDLQHCCLFDPATGTRVVEHG